MLDRASECLLNLRTLMEAQEITTTSPLSIQPAIGGQPTKVPVFADRVGAILELVHDPLFVEFELEQEASSVFNVAGRTHTETWHSALLGWLLDQEGSHGLRDFPLRRFVLLQKREDRFSKRELDLGELLIRGSFGSARVRPNERELTEVSVNNVGRFDILVDQLILSPFKEVQLLVEIKVNTRIDREQCAKYVDYIHKRKAEGVIIVPVFLAREERLLGSSAELFGSPEWIKLDYQVVYEELIQPCLAHPGITPFGKIALIEYVKTLKRRNNGGKTMIITQRERDLAGILRERHELALTALYEILDEESDDFSPLPAADGTADTTGPACIRIRIGDELVEAESVPEFYLKALKLLASSGYLDRIELPVASGAKRYLIAREPLHQLGNPFKRHIHFGGYYMETNKSRERAVGDLLKLGERYGIPIAYLT